MQSGSRRFRLAGRDFAIIDLTERAGWPLKLDAETVIVSFGAQMRMPQYSTRELEALRPVLLDPDADGPEIMYWMYRNCGRPQDAGVNEAHDLRYDLTVFRPFTVGREFIKTSGHYHPVIPGRRAAYPEVYEVVSGEAFYVMQKIDDYAASPEEVVVEDVIMARVGAGQKIIMPPGYGHVTINPLDEPLVMSNWVSSRFSSYYGAVEQARGFAYYVIDDDGEPGWIENRSYVRGVPQARRAEVQEAPELGIVWDKPLYQCGVDDPEAFEFLNDPVPYEELIWEHLSVEQ